MFLLLFVCASLGATYAAPGHLDYGHYGDAYGHSSHLQYVAPAIIKPVVEHIPVYNHHAFDHGYGHHDYGHHSYAHAPVYHAPAPVVKVAAPVVKTYAPATSYAQVTTYKVAHVQPIVKAIVPQPIIKSYVPTYAHDYGYHGGHDYHHGYGGHDYHH